ncbi:MAG: outer membrane beta-barrel protein [Acetobacter sp.]|nr:outer membrane beta-barrel protein [Acetobacter sp.]
MIIFYVCNFDRIREPSVVFFVFGYILLLVTLLFFTADSALALGQPTRSVYSGVLHGKHPLTIISLIPPHQYQKEIIPEGNIFHHKPGTPHSYWDALQGHIVLETGIAGNPWTTSGRNFGQYYDDRANTITLNQIMGTLFHPVEDIGHGYGIGFTLQSLYGSDGRFDPTAGIASHTFSTIDQWVPTQAHLDVKFPWLFKRGIDVQLGLMYGLLDSEGTPALERPFYTVNYATDYISPFETVSAAAWLHVTRTMDILLDIDAGDSVTFGRYGNNKRPKGYFGLLWNNLLNGRFDFHIIGRFGPEGNNGPTYRVGPWTSAGVGPIANDKMQYNGDFLARYRINKKMRVSAIGTFLLDDLTNEDAYGVTGYFAYDINRLLTFNARVEVFRDNSGGAIVEYVGPTSYTKYLTNRAYPYYDAPPTTYSDFTIGVTYKPEFINKRTKGYGQLYLRPEIRLDKSLNGTRPFNKAAIPTAANHYDPVVRDGTNNMLWFSCDAIWAY